MSPSEVADSEEEKLAKALVSCQKASQGLSELVLGARQFRALVEAKEALIEAQYALDRAMSVSL